MTCISYQTHENSAQDINTETNITVSTTTHFDLTVSTTITLASVAAKKKKPFSTELFPRYNKKPTMKKTAVRINERVC